MKVFKEISISDFEAWSGAEETQQAIIEADKETEFDSYIDELYPDGINETDLNDILRFEAEELFSALGIEEEEEEEDEEEDQEDTEAGEVE